MDHCVKLAEIRVVHGVLHVGLEGAGRTIAIRAPLTADQAHALRHLYAAGKLCSSAADDRYVGLLRKVAHAAGGALTAVVVDITGNDPSFRVRVGCPTSWEDLPLQPAEAVLVLAANELPIEVVVPEPPEDWDTALADLLARERDAPDDAPG